MAAKIARWREKPDAFVRQVIGASPDPWQVRVLRELREAKKVSVAACHGPGKDAVAAWAVLWVMSCWKHPKVPCTAPTSHQLHDLLWAEIAKWFARMPALWRGMFELKKDRFERRNARKTWFAAARTARKENSEALQGFHADVVLVVVDEASGVPDVIFEVLEGATTGPLAFVLLIGNPTQTAGAFHRSHHADRDQWVCIRVMAEAAHDGSPLPPNVYTSARVTVRYVEDMARKYGRDSNVFRVRVLGMFPASEADQVIPLEWVEACRMRDLPAGWTSKHEAVAGLDVARFGEDDSALVVRQGPLIRYLETWHGHDLHETAGKATTAIKLLWEQGVQIRFLFVDGVGIGADVVKRLYDDAWLHEHKVGVVDVQAGLESPDDECERLRDALWWRGRRYFNPRAGNEHGERPYFLAGLPVELVDRLAGELASPKYGYSVTRQRIKVESKEKMKDRQVGSPDLADAWLLTLAFEVGMPPPPGLAWLPGGASRGSYRRVGA